jgi:hypothetical protein
MWRPLAESFHLASPSWLRANEDLVLRMTMTRRTICVLVLLALLAGLVWFSSHLAALRIYQVDECQNLYMARVLATGHTAEFFTNASLFLLGPLCWISRTATRASDAFDMARLLFLGVFWLNLALIAAIAGGKFYSVRTLVALVAAATLAPLWDYGFEVRHDNLVLAGVLLIWWGTRIRPFGLASYVFAGAVSVAMLFTAVKAVVYVVPLCCALLVFPPPGITRCRWRLALSGLAGAVVATLLIRAAYGNSGGWQIYLSVFHGVARYSTGGGGGAPGFAPWATLGRLLGQTPLLLVVGIAACYAVLADMIHRRRHAFTWEGIFPEFLLFLGVLGALAINPTPYAYNLLHVVPYLFIFAFRYAAGICGEIWAQANLRPVIASTLVFAHVVPFGVATRRHVEMVNWRQGQLMALAEDLTDPAKDPVYDGIGMVLTRPTIHYQWYLHGLNIQSFLNGTGPRVCDMLAARPPAVVIPSYRTDWLSEEDHDFIRQRYVPVSDDFWVLGKTLPAGGGTFEVYHPGRYRISTLKGSDLADTYPLGLKGIMTPEDAGTIHGTLDGVPFMNKPVELCEGTHRLECTADCQPAVVWMGPRRDRIRRIGPGDHRRLFVNWY